MGARGPRVGSGDVSAWIVSALRTGNKTRHELGMGSAFTDAQIEDALTRLVRNSAVAVAGEPKRPGPSNRPGTVYQLIETKIASSPCFSARKRSINATRTLDDAFHRIVGSR